MAERTGDLALAERCYEREVPLPIAMLSTTGKRPCETVLRRLYVKEHGNAKGFAAYTTALGTDRMARQQARIVAERLAEPRRMPPFVLADTSARKLESERLRGKLLVVHFWTRTCPPCLWELPQWAELARAYAADPDVQIVTVDADEHVEGLQRRQSEHDYTFPIYLGGEWTYGDANVRAFPTTWFVDREGWIQYEKAGASLSLFDEFAWRIEALRGGGSPPPNRD